MYKLIIHNSHPNPVWGSEVFKTLLNTSIEEVMLWRQIISFSDDSVVDYNIDIDVLENYTVACETWEFSDRDSLLKFYKKLALDDKNISAGKPYIEEEYIKAFVDYKIEKVDKIINPDSTEEILYSNKELL